MMQMNWLLAGGWSERVTGRAGGLLCAVIAMIAALPFIGLAGCQRPPAPASGAHVQHGPSVERAELTHGQRREIEAVFRDVAAGHSPTPDRQPEPVRWSHVRQAVDAACTDLEMAVAQVVTIDEFTRQFRIRTIDDRPASLIVTRDDEVDPNFRATATVGLFEDDFESARRLIEAVEAELAQLPRR